MKLARKTLIGIKSETTQGTAVSPAAATAGDYLLALDVEVKPIREIVERDYYRGSLDRVAHVIGKKHSTVSFKTEIKHSTEDTPLTGFTAALKACGFSFASGTGIFTPISDAPSSNFYGPATSCTINVYKDGIKHQLVGCVGSVKFSFEAGKIAYAEFNFSGIDTISEEANPSITFENVTPLVVASSTLSVNGVSTFICSKFDIDVDNTIAMRDDINSANGIKGFVIVNRNPKGSADPEVDGVTVWTNLAGATEASSTITINGTDVQDIIFTLPQTQITDVSYSDRNGILAANCSLAFNSSAAGNDYMSINFSVDGES